MKMLIAGATSMIVGVMFGYAFGIAKGGKEDEK